MNGSDPVARLRIGLIGSGFIANFHLQALLSVRHVSVTGILSPTAAHREALAAKANALELGPCRAFASLEAMLLPARSTRCGSACQTSRSSIPCARSIAWCRHARQACRRGLRKAARPTRSEAREMLRLVEDAKLLHGYLENQVFSSAIKRGKDIVWRRAVPACGRPYLARAAEEHSGPRMPWFWQGRRQGGGVLYDMTCHSVGVGRFLLTKPGAPRSDLKLVSASATVGDGEWTRRQGETAERDDGPGSRLRVAAGGRFRPRRADLVDPDGHEVMVGRPTPGPMSAPACAS